MAFMHLTRSHTGALALTFILAAASPASAADPTVLDTTYGAGGFSSYEMPRWTNATAPITVAAPGGGTTTVYASQSIALRAADDPSGVTIVARDAAGKVTGQLFNDDVLGNNGIRVFDVRYVGDVLVIAGSSDNIVWSRDLEGDGNYAWTITVTPAGTMDVRLLRGCDVADGGILADGKTVFVDDCEGTEVEQVDPFARDTRGAAVPGKIANFHIRAIDVDSQDRILGLTLDAGQVVRIDPDAPTVIDPTYGTNGVAIVDVPSPRDLVVDGQDRVVVGGYASMPGRGTAEDRPDLQFERLVPSGATPDAGFGTAGSVAWTDGDPETSLSLDALAVDDQDRVLGSLSDSWSGKAGVLRLTSGGVPDTTFGPNGLFALGTEETSVAGFGPALGLGGATYVTATTFPNQRRSATLPTQTGRQQVVLRLADPKPVTPPPAATGGGAQQPAAQAPTPVQTTATSTSAPRTARTCLSRRNFTIRLRPRQLRSATVTVAGKKVRTTRKDGRLTAKVDLRKLEQATFRVVVTGTTAKGRSIRETRTYNTCRVGEDGPKVKGGSVVITVGA